MANSLLWKAVLCFIRCIPDLYPLGASSTQHHPNLAATIKNAPSQCPGVGGKAKPLSTTACENHCNKLKMLCRLCLNHNAGGWLAGVQRFKHGDTWFLTMSTRGQQLSKNVCFPCYFICQITALPTYFK